MNKEKKKDWILEKEVKDKDRIKEKKKPAQIMKKK